MERVRDRELERGRKRGNDRGHVRDVGERRVRASSGEGLMEMKERKRGGRRQCKHRESNGSSNLIQINH